MNDKNKIIILIIYLLHNVTRAIHIKSKNNNLIASV